MRVAGHDRIGVVRLREGDQVVIGGGRLHRARRWVLDHRHSIEEGRDEGRARPSVERLANVSRPSKPDGGGGSAQRRLVAPKSSLIEPGLAQDRAEGAAWDLLASGSDDDGRVWLTVLRYLTWLPRWETKAKPSRSKVLAICSEE